MTDEHFQQLLDEIKEEIVTAQKAATKRAHNDQRKEVFTVTNAILTLILIINGLMFTTMLSNASSISELDKRMTRREDNAFTAQNGLTMTQSLSSVASTVSALAERVAYNSENISAHQDPRAGFHDYGRAYRERAREEGG